MFKTVFLLFGFGCLLVCAQKPEPKEYVVIQKEANWIGAIEFCHRIRMQPAVVSSAQQQRQIEEAVAASPEPTPGPLGKKTYYWIGASNLSSKRWFIWEPTGQPLTYAKWEANQPSPKFNCIALGYSASTLERGQWSTADCDQQLKQFVCEASPR
ncbi:lectin subunit alpha-like [Culex pipiens pallens]|uniref:lectin subunit alpha-like n=1 Tax=Culex pipiens pallens TaxID=42434 RepID=UPI0019539C1C|nr:lectin subunit alpha-like [Culex pipiens pallens]